MIKVGPSCKKESKKDGVEIIIKNVFPSQDSQTFERFYSNCHRVKKPPVSYMEKIQAKSIRADMLPILSSIMKSQDILQHYLFSEKYAMR